MAIKPQAMSVRSPVHPSGGRSFEDLDYGILEVFLEAGDSGIDTKDVQAKFPTTPIIDKVGLMVNTGLLEEMEEGNGEPLPNRFCINDWGRKALTQRGKRSIGNVQASAKAEAQKPRRKGSSVRAEDNE